MPFAVALPTSGIPGSRRRHFVVRLAVLALTLVVGLATVVGLQGGFSGSSSSERQPLLDLGASSNKARLAAPRRRPVPLKANEGGTVLNSERPVPASLPCGLVGPPTSSTPAVADSLVFDPRPCHKLSFPAVCNVEKQIPMYDNEMPPLWQASAAWNQAWGDSLPASCHYSDAYRFIFVKNAKTGSSSIGPGFLRPSVCPIKPGESGRSVFFYAPFSESCSKEEYFPLDTDYLPCNSIPRAKWLHYYVFTSIRDPIERAASAYSYCQKQESGVSLTDWCRNPNKGGGPCSENNVTDAPNVHWAAQTGSFCDAKRGSCIVDYVVRVESLVEDMDTVISSINAGRNASYPALPSFSSRNVTINSQAIDAGDSLKALKVSERADEIIRQLESEPCKEALLDWYLPDFDLMGYIRPGEVCQTAEEGEEQKKRR